MFVVLSNFLSFFEGENARLGLPNTATSIALFALNLVGEWVTTTVFLSKCLVKSRKLKNFTGLKKCSLRNLIFLISCLACHLFPIRKNPAPGACAMPEPGQKTNFCPQNSILGFFVQSTMFLFFLNFFSAE